MSTDTRIASLESQVRTMKRMLFGVVGTVVVGGLLAATSVQPVPDVIRAKKFEVVNAEGESVAELLASEFGGGVSVRNNDGRIVGALTSYEGWGVLGIYNENGEVVARLRADGDGVLQFFNNDSKVVVESGVDADGHGSSKTMDASGKITSSSP